MILAKIPSRIVLSPISEISPSRYAWLRDGCAYSYLLETSLRTISGPSMLMPPFSFNNVIGTIIHKIFQLVNSNQLECSEDAITNKWMDLCQERRNAICEQYPTLRNIAIGDYDAMFDTIDVARKMYSSGVSEMSVPSNVSKYNEHILKIENLLKGSIDRIRPVSGGYEIVDYKTGKIYSENGDIKQEYVAQLNLYAYMLVEKENVKVTRLIIIDRFGDEISVPYYEDQKDIVLNSVGQTLKVINHAVSNNTTEQLCKPSFENCNFCVCQHLCQKRETSEDSPFHIIEGTVSKVWNNDQISLLVDNLGEILIAKLSPLGFDNISGYVGKRLIFVNLLQIIEGVQYNRCDKTAIYERI